jgi:Polyketide cyclase / dehydrase and lipid transport
MASITFDIAVDPPPEEVWDAVRDVGAVHERLVPELIKDTRLEGSIRVITFGDGSVIRERIVDIDDESRRIAYAAIEGGPPHDHHNSSMQVVADGKGGSRVIWTTDFLPDELAGTLRGVLEQAAVTIEETLNESARAAR